MTNPLSVTLQEIKEQRAKGWIDFHPEDYCHRCGGKNVESWWVDSDRWQAAFPNGDAEYNGIVCPGCFVDLHKEHTGLKCSWKLVSDTPFRHVEEDGPPQEEWDPVKLPVDKLPTRFLD